MKILLTNDDGWHAAGIRAARERLMVLGRVILVAPSSECSATSHAITVNQPLRVDGSHGPDTYSVDGKPADCVKLALGHLLDSPPDLVVSGINRGANLGVDTLVSGTVAGAMEAAMAGLPAIAISCSGEEGQEFLYSSASEILYRFVSEKHMFFRRGEVLNLNVPNLPLAEIKGFRKAMVSRANYESQCVEAHDPRGRPYYWYRGSRAQCATADSDISIVDQGYVSVSVLRPSLFCKESTESLAYLN